MRYYFFLSCLLSSSSSMAMDSDDPSSNFRFVRIKEEPGSQKPSSFVGASLDSSELRDDEEDSPPPLGIDLSFFPDSTPSNSLTPIERLGERSLLTFVLFDDDELSTLEPSPVNNILEPTPHSTFTTVNTAKRTARPGEKTGSNKRSRTNESLGEEVSNQFATLPSMPQGSTPQPSSSRSSNLPMTPQEENDFKSLKQAAAKGELTAQSSLGEMYATGRVPGGISPENDAEAVRLFRQGAEKGDVTAQVWLGWMHAAGRVPGKTPSESDEEAVRLFRQGAEKENVIGQRRLGWMYMQGRVPGGRSPEIIWKPLSGTYRPQKKGIYFHSTTLE
ncbi:MAG: sel1 repeat family protein [Alphaproteobacteria bacterium]|nr:sel1 repeat family protein [Alphaproteobacteria bacterium]